MSQPLIDMLRKCRDQFLFYREQHISKGSEDGRKKAIVNGQFADEIESVLAKHSGEDLSALERLADYRFGTLIKGEHYAFARGLTINPAHLPAALDAMKRDGFELLAIFGQTDAQNIGFIFRIVGPDPRVQGLLEANNVLLEENRRLKREATARQDNLK